MKRSVFVGLPYHIQQENLQKGFSKNKTCRAQDLRIIVRTHMSWLLLVAIYIASAQELLLSAVHNA